MKSYITSAILKNIYKKNHFSNQRINSIKPYKSRNEFMLIVFKEGIRSLAKMFSTCMISGLVNYDLDGNLVRKLYD